MKIVPIRENDDSAKLDIVDAIAREIDAMWGLIGTLQTIYTETGCDAYARGALRIAHAHLDSLCAFQHDLDKLLQSEPTAYGATDLVLTPQLWQLRYRGSKMSRLVARE